MRLASPACTPDPPPPSGSFWGTSPPKWVFSPRSDPTQRGHYGMDAARMGGGCCGVCVGGGCWGRPTVGLEEGWEAAEPRAVGTPRLSIGAALFPLNKAPGDDVGIPQWKPGPLGPYFPQNGADEAAPGVAVRAEGQEEARPSMAGGRYHGDRAAPRSPLAITAHAHLLTSSLRACPSAHAHIHARPLCARASHSAALLRMRISPRSPSAHAHLPAPTLCACALLRAAAPAHHGRRRPLLRRLRHFFLPTWRAAMGSLSSRLLRRRGGLSLGDGAAGEGGRGGRGGGRRGGKRKRGGGEGPGDSESDSDSEREERLHSAPRRSGGGGGGRSWQC